MLGMVSLVIWTLIDHGGISTVTPMIVSIVLLVLVLTTQAQRFTKKPQARPSRIEKAYYGVSAPNLPWPTLMGILLLFTAYLQTVDLPRTLLSYVAPGSEAIQREWVPISMLKEMIGSSDTPLDEKLTNAEQFATVSVDPWRTKLAMAGLLSFSICCWISSRLRWTRDRLYRLLASFTMIGVFLSVFGAADHLILSRDWQHELRTRLWITPVGADSPFATFINSNNAAGFLHLCLACSVGLLWARKPSSNKTSTRYSEVLVYGSILIISVGIFSTESRGASVAWIVGAITLTILNLKKTSLLRVIIGLLTVVLVTGLFVNAIGTGETTFDRLRSVIDGRALENVRVNHWHDSLNCGVHFLPFGAGLGTYRYAYLPFQTKGSDRWFVNADGMPVEWFVETGVIGICFFAVSVAMLIIQLKRLTDSINNENDTDRHRALTAVKNLFVYLLPAVLISQSFDFGITLPSLYLVLAILLGILHSFSSPCKQARQAETAKQSPSGRNLQPSITIATLACLLYILYVTSSTQVINHSLRRIERTTAENRRAPVSQWKPFTLEEHQLRTWSAENHSEVHRVLSNVIIRNQQERGRTGLIEKGFDVDSLTPGLFSLQFIRAVIIQNATNESRPDQSVKQTLLPTQDVDKFYEARNQAIHGLLASPLDPRFKIRLVELDFLNNDDQLSEHFLSQARQLRKGDVAINAYLNRLKIAGNPQ